MTSSIRQGPVSAETIQEIANNISSGISGASVYLFGSYAYGKPNRNSDVDLAVIYPDSFAEEKVDLLARRLARHPEVAKDVIAIRASRFAQRSQDPGTLSWRILQEGVPLG